MKHHFFRGVVVAALSLSIHAVQAEPGHGRGRVGTTTASPGERVTEYDLSASHVEVETEIENSSAHDGLMLTWLSTALKPRVLEHPNISNIQLVGREPSVRHVTWGNYNEVSREAHLFVTVNYQQPFSLLFRATESFRRCADQGSSSNMESEDFDDNWDEVPTSQSTCQLRAELKVEGPIAVYGSYNSHLNPTAMIKNRQTIQFTMGKSFDKSDTTMKTRFSVNSNDWEARIFKFMDMFNITPDLISNHNDVAPLVGGGGTHIITRQALFLGIARMVRMTNERILE